MCDILTLVLKPVMHKRTSSVRRFDMEIINYWSGIQVLNKQKVIVVSISRIDPKMVL